MGKRFRKIDPYIWNDAKFRSLSALGQLAFLFVLTHQHMTAVGAMRGTIEGLASEHADLKPKAFAEALAKGMIKAHREACFLWAPNFIKYNAPESPNVVKGWKKALDLLPECDLKNELIYQLHEHLKAFDKAFGKAFTQAFPMPLRKPLPNQEQEQEQEQKKKNPLRKSADLRLAGGGVPFYWTKKGRRLAGKRLDGFNRFWAVVEPKKDKARAADAWLAIPKIDDALVERIIKAAERKAAEVPVLRAQGRTPQYPEGWLSGRRWEDETDEESDDAKYEEAFKRAGL